MIEVTPELLERYDRPGPRYTSYPTAVEFHEGVGATEYEQRLRAAAVRSDQPLSLYVHLPFCEARCSFCACHVVVTRHKEVAAAYLPRLSVEAGMVAERLGERRRLVQYHWGGGTPTHHPPAELAALHETLLDHFTLAPDAEVAVEVDPRVTTDAHLETLAGLGFNRLSLGVQDLDPEVQDLIGRHQTRRQTEHTYLRARELGFASINLDLIYGLPGQTEARFMETLEAVVALQPERLAVYSFAFVPWLRTQQRRIDESALPGRDLKFRLLARLVATLTGAGYRQIGMDHFALPTDELALAAGAGTLTRNFMGYTTRRGTEVVALGTSGISDIDGAYVQNHRRLASYYQDVDQARLPIERGYSPSEDDRLRRHIITELMCNGAVLFADVEQRFGVAFTDRLAAELAELSAPGGLIEEGMAEVDEGAIRATDLGRLFVRRLAAVFDVHSGQREGDRPVFSKVV